MQNQLDYFVSNFDIEKKIKHKMKIIQYKDLYKYKSLKTLLPNKLSILIILINTASRSGHWTLLVRQDKLLTYFDSYGKAVDAELQYIDSSEKTVLHENKPYLSTLIDKMLADGYQLVQNNKPFQSHKNNVNTCGKYVIYVANCILKGLDLTEIQDLLVNTRKETKQSYDNIVNHYFNNFF